MQFRERKNLTSDRVILVPGPAEEVETIRKIFQMVLQRHTLKQIARHLNERGVRGPCRGKGKWCISSLCEIIENPKYMGTQIWARRTGKLGGRRVTAPENEWVIKKNAFEPIVDEPTFTAAQELIAHSKSDQYLLDRLRFVLATEGCLGRWEIRTTPGVPCEETYVNRFGSLKKAFALAGYERRDLKKAYQTVHRVLRLREEVVKSLLSRFPKKVRLEQKNRHRRPILHFVGDPPLLVVVCKSITLRDGSRRWMRPAHIDWQYRALLCFCNPMNTGIQAFALFSGIPQGKLLFNVDDINPGSCRSATDVCSLFSAARA